MNDYTPSVEGIRAVLVYLSKYKARDQGDVDLVVVESETIEQFERMIAGVRAKAWEEGAESAFYNPEIRGLVDYPDENPYRRVMGGRVK